MFNVIDTSVALAYVEQLGSVIGAPQDRHRAEADIQHTRHHGRTLNRLRTSESRPAARCGLCVVFGGQVRNVVPSAATPPPGQWNAQTPSPHE